MDEKEGSLDNITWKESSIPPDSSSGETGKDTPPEVVHFTVGEGNEEITKSPTKEKSGMVRSYSQEANMMVLADDKATTSSFLSKTSYSDNSLDTPERMGYRPGVVRKSLKELPTVMSMDDETLSTDSNSTVDNDELKRRRRKIHFPAFRKNKTKIT